MKITRNKAMDLWEKAYGNANFAEDFAGALMFKATYGDTECYLVFNGEKYCCGWNLHHILPKSLGGISNEENLACTNIVTNRATGDKTSYWIDEEHYQVRRVKGKHRYEIIRL